MHPTSWWALCLACMALPAAAESSCPSRTELPPTVNFRVDNDLFGGQDQGYTSGVQLGFVSPNLADYTNDPCLPAMARWVNRHLKAIQPSGYDQQNMVFTVNQAIFTPKDWSRRDVIADDRPYAAALLFGFGYNARKGQTLRTTLLRVGLVGPHAYGQQVQDAIHKITDSHAFEGWDNQLHDEPVFMLQHERMRRYGHGPGAGIWSGDAIVHYGAAVGNFQTFANTGFELRWGRHLPDDFLSTPLRPAGENTAPRSETASPGGVFRIHAFLTADARWVLHDITLDGNTFRDSHSVDRRPLVAYVGYGVAVMKGRWKFALARYHSTREFDTQTDPPVFGSFTISRTL